MSAGRTLLTRIWSELGEDLRILDNVDAAHAPVPLPSRLATGELAWASVAAAVTAAGGHVSSIDPERVATAYRSDRVLTIDGKSPSVWSAFSGFWSTGDGWIRTHGNYPHHASALRTGLHLNDAASGDHIRTALSALTSAAAVEAITTAGGLAVRVMEEDPREDAVWRREPLLDVRHSDTATVPLARASPTAQHPLAGLRVLDLTRVIAGPVCTRTLALLGAEVLRIDPPALREWEWQQLDTGHGKRSAILDARSERFSELLAGADAVVLGYRPAALARLGLTREALTREHPGLVIAQLSAWGPDQPDRAGFDSLVQAESGIALVESVDGERPGALPAQALDHSAGYLLAAAVTILLKRRAEEGGSWFVQTSLRRIAAELLGMSRAERPGVDAAIDPAPHVADFRVDGRDLVTARPVLPGFEFAPPHTWEADQPRW